MCVFAVLSAKEKFFEAPFSILTANKRKENTSTCFGKHLSHSDLLS